MRVVVGVAGGRLGSRTRWWRRWRRAKGVVLDGRGFELDHAVHVSRHATMRIQHRRTASAAANSCRSAATHVPVLRLSFVHEGNVRPAPQLYVVDGEAAVVFHLPRGAPAPPTVLWTAK